MHHKISTNLSNILYNSSNKYMNEVLENNPTENFEMLTDKIIKTHFFAIKNIIWNLSSMDNEYHASIVFFINKVLTDKIANNSHDKWDVLKTSVRIKNRSVKNRLMQLLMYPGLIFITGNLIFNNFLNPFFNIAIGIFIVLFVNNIIDLINEWNQYKDLNKTLDMYNELMNNGQIDLNKIHEEIKEKTEFHTKKSSSI